MLLVDEAQEMKVSVLAELRLLSSMNLDARALLILILAGDERLTAKYPAPDVLPIASRIRTRLHLGYLEPERLRAVLDSLLKTPRSDHHRFPRSGSTWITPRKRIV